MSEKENILNKIAENSDYITNNLIAYIGNKRRLVNLIVRAIEEVRDNGSQKINFNGSFIDYFAGSGVVSRLAKSIGFQVISNDWEYYSYIINKSFLELDEVFLKEFETESGLDNILNNLNHLNNKPNQGYISKYYCPKDDDNIDTEKERMFYTQKNGRLIDNIREAINSLYPRKNKKNIQKKDLLIALLLYQSSLRSNTNGVFKAFHNGFGGKKGDALNRILSSVRLEKPILSKTKNKKCKVFRSDANKLVEKLKNKYSEIVYLDPPYNQHQYGSNYHLLNTIALDDRPEIKKEFFIEGKKVRKSGIRTDWKKTKSPYCYRQTAKEKFSQLVDKINAKYIFISYSTEGIIEFDDMLDILIKKGKIGIVTESYTRYRGGRNIENKNNKNVEFILMVDTAVKCHQQDINNVKRVLLKNRFVNLFEKTFTIDSFKKKDAEEKDFEIIKEGSKYKVCLKFFNISFFLDDDYKIEKKSFDKVFKMSYQEQNNIYNLLQNECR